LKECLKVLQQSFNFSYVHVAIHRTGDCWKMMVQDLSTIITVHEQQISTVDGFVSFGALMHSAAQSTPDLVLSRLLYLISSRSKQVNVGPSLWHSRISLSMKMKFYNTCTLQVFLYSSECWGSHRGGCMQDQCRPSVVPPYASWS